MKDLIIKKDYSVSIVPDDWEKLVAVSLGRGRKISIVGTLRSSEESVRDFFHLASINTLDRKQLQQIIETIAGEILLVVEDENSITICLGYNYPELFLIEKTGASDFFHFTNDETKSTAQGFVDWKLLLRYLSNQGLYIPGGIGSGSDDFVLPGMMAVINKKNGHLEQDWILPIETLADDADHKNSTEEIADAFIREMKSYENVQEPVYLELSSGVDSALIAAAANEARLNLQAINFKAPGLSGESVGANKIAKYFGFPFEVLETGPVNAGESFGINTDLENYLSKTSPILAAASGMFVLDNVSLILPYRKGYVHTLEGSAYPTALCIAHYTCYPRARFKKFNPFDYDLDFDPQCNKEKRFYYGDTYLNQRLKKVYKDDFSLLAEIQGVDPFYVEFIKAIYYGTSRREVNNLFPASGFYMGDNSKIKDAMGQRLTVILNKILLSPLLRNGMKCPDAKIAAKLMKLIVYINNIGWAATKLYAYRKAGLYQEYRPGLASAVIARLLNVKVDDYLVNYPKKHIFDAFTHMTGRSFFEIQGYEKSKASLALAYAKRVRESRFFVNSPRRYVSNNKSVMQFARDRGLDNLHDEILCRYDLDLPCFDGFEKSRKSEAGFWYMNNVLNIASLASKKYG